MITHEDEDESRVRAAMADLVNGFRHDADRDEILHGVTAQATALIGGIDCASVLLFDGPRLQSVAATCPRAADVDAVQLRHGEGPCVSAASASVVVTSADLTADTRWPRFAPEAVASGVRAAMSFPLYAGSPNATLRARGALNVFGPTAHDFSGEQTTIGAMLATLAAGALTAAERGAQLQSALGSRDVIGQAKGILMERFEIDAVRAFEMLVKLSQDGNTPVRVVAQRVVHRH